MDVDAVATEFEHMTDLGAHVQGEGRVERRVRRPPPPCREPQITNPLITAMRLPPASAARSTAVSPVGNGNARPSAGFGTRKTVSVGLEGTKLTDQEWHIASLVGAGSSNKAVARELTISIKTVEFHLGNVYRKLGIGTRAELAYLVGSNSPRIVGRSHTAGNLPRERSALIGRDDTLDHVTRLIIERSIVTLTGPAGIGKTRLAIAAGRATSDEFGDGVWMVELRSVADGRDVPNASAIALGLSPRSSASTAADVATALGRQRRLIILDNCEHVITDAATLARAIVTNCPNVVILATSRERLNMADERLVLVPPMSVDPIDGMSPAAQLFVARAVEVLGAFEPSERDRDGGRRRVPTARRAAAGNRTCGGTPRRAGCSRDPRSARRSVRAAGSTAPRL